MSRITKAIDELLEEMMWLNELDHVDGDSFVKATSLVIKIFESRALDSKSAINSERGRLAEIKKALVAENRTLEMKARVIFGDEAVDAAIVRNNKRRETEESSKELDTDSNSKKGGE